MLYVGCGFCRAIVPLWCSGQFMPHLPVLVVRGPMGVYCGMCGLLPPFFTCTFCWMRQMLFLPGIAVTPSAMSPGQNMTMAPVVQVQPGTPENLVPNFINELTAGFAKQFGSELASMVFRGWLGGSA